MEEGPLLMSAAMHVSLAEYLDYVAPEGFDDELIEGEIILSPSPKIRHENVCCQLFLLLTKSLEGSDFIVRRDTSMALETHDSMPRPDVFVIDRERWNRSEQEETYPQGSPQLAIEVFSPGNRPGLMQKKAALYLNTGASAVWIAYPKRQTVVVHDAEGEREYRVGEDLLLPAPLPETPVAVQKIFEAS
jgi:Uma2 family endonuclease